MKSEIRNMENIHWDKIGLLMKIGIVGAFTILIGDFLVGWGVRDVSLGGIEGMVSPYRTISDGMIFWSAILGLIGVPMATVGHLGVYRLMKPYSRKYAKLYKVGMLGFLTFGGSGVHVSSLATVFFYKYMAAVSPETALASSIKFASYFPLPLYIASFACWLLLSYAYIRAFITGLSPYPRWCWVFSMPVGTLLASLVIIFGNHAIVNAIMVGASSLGNIWQLAGLFFILGKAKENWHKVSA